MCVTIKSYFTSQLRDRTMKDFRCPECNQPLSRSTSVSESGAAEHESCKNCGWPSTLNPERMTRLVETQPDSSDLAPTKRQGVTQTDHRIAHFALRRKLGSGGFGAVWLAEDLNLQRQVALKLPKHVGGDSMLMHEARTAAKLHHPNIVTVHEVGIENDQVYIASEYIDGFTLRGEMRNGRLKTDRIVRLMISLSRAAAHAHANGVIHRDLKPTNVMVNAEGVPFITDFGIAKQLSAEKTISSEGAVVGTFNYMSPEQAMGRTRDTDQRADIYALGVMLFEMLTENRPFRGNVEAIIRQKINEDPPSPRRLVAAIPADLETICLKCLERDRNNRYLSAIELAEELERYQQGVPIHARPISRLEKGWRWCRRRPLVAGLTAGIFASLFIGLSSTSYFWAQAATNASQTRQALYRAQLNLIGTRWINGDLAGLKSALTAEPVRSLSQSNDDFAFHYYEASLKPFRQIVSHGEGVIDVAVSHDGRFFASLGRDNVILVWDAENGKHVRTLQVPSGQVIGIDFSPIDGRLASAHSDGRLRIWNPTQHPRVVAELNHGPGLTQVRFCGRDDHLLSADRRGQMKLWNLDSGDFETVGKRKSPVVDMRSTADGNRIAVAYQDGFISLINLQSGFSERELPRCPNVLCLTFIDDGKRLVAGSRTAACRIYNTESGDLVHTIDGDGAIGDSEYLNRINRFALASSSGSLQIFDDRYLSRCSLTTHTRTYGVLAQSADGGALAVGSADGTVTLIDVDSFRRPATMWHDTNLRDVSFISNDEVVTCGGDGALILWDLETGEHKTLSPRTNRAALTLAVLGSSKQVAVAGASFSVDIFALENDSAKETQITLPHAGITASAYSDVQRLLALGARNGNVALYSIDDPKSPVWETSEADAAVYDLCWSPDSQRLAIAFSNQRIGIVNHDGTTFQERPLALDAVPTAVAFDRWGKLLAVGTQTGEIVLISVPDNIVTRSIKCHGSRISSMAMLPNGTQVVTGGRDRDLHVWDLESGESIATLPGHNRQVFAVAVAPDGRTIVSVGLEGDLRVWRGR